MIYTWIDVNTKFTIEVEREMQEYLIPPYKEECMDAGMEIGDFAAAVWKKVVTGGSFSKGFGQKGHW